MGTSQQSTSVQFSHCQTTIADPLEFYRASVQLYGHNNVFLLESLTGPEIDAQDTVIGLTGALEVSITAQTITLSGIPALLGRTYQIFNDHELFTVHADSSITYHTNDAVWVIPSLIYTAIFGTDLPTVDNCAQDLGLISMFGYDTVFYIEKMEKKISPDTHTPPDIVFSVITALIDIDKHTGKAEVYCLSAPYLPHWDITQWLALKDRTCPPSAQSSVPPAIFVEDDTTLEDYLAGVEVCKSHIMLGDIYQVQYGHKITVYSDVDPVDVYQRLRERNPSPYMSILPIAHKTIIGASPELFIRVENNTITMRPIAGTAPRTGIAQKDDKAIVALLADEKECAEHIMLVDLCRNDFGRVCIFGTIEVTELMSIEAYSHVFHIVSHVEAQITDRVNVLDVIKATFPAGTMTGAPKIRAMEIIENIECTRRGYYAGAFGIVRLFGSSVLGLAIRMTVHEPSTRGSMYTLRASAGIVADSIPENEWRETLVKLAAPYWAITDQEILEVYSCAI